jgi:hypothetical protein
MSVDCIVGFLINKEFEFEFNWYFTKKKNSMRAEEAKSHYNQRIRERPFNLKGGLWFFSKKIF